MASIKGALKKVYKALSGGTDTKAKSISGIIDDISTVASGGGGGGINLFEITHGEPTYDSANRMACATSTITANQIIQAMNNGRIPYMRVVYDITIEDQKTPIHLAYNGHMIGGFIYEMENEDWNGHEIMIGSEKGGGAVADVTSGLDEPLTFYFQL